MRERNPNWLEIPNHPYRMLIIGGSGSGKTSSLLNLKNHQPDIGKTYVLAKGRYEDKYQFLSSKQESTAFKPFNDPKVFF